MPVLRSVAGVAGVIAAGLATSIVVAQTAPKPAPASAAPTMGSISFATSVGSFKLLGPGEVPPQGKLSIQFSGTVLVSGLEKGSKLTTSGNVIREINDTKNGKAVYHGSGSMVIDGKAHAVQFFGRDLKGRFEGQGIFRLYGEFDKKLETGWYQHDGEEKFPWGTGGMTVVIPSQKQATPKARIRVNPGGG